MQLDFQSETPIYIQIAQSIEDAVFIGAFAEETQIPSTTEISTRYAINPATVLKGMNLLVERSILYKRRGLGMFVKQGAIETVKRIREERFSGDYIAPMLREAQKLGLKPEDIISLVQKEWNHEHD